MDDCRKSQTLDSLPGKAGGLPILIINGSDIFYALKSVNSRYSGSEIELTATRHSA